MHYFVFFHLDGDDFLKELHSGLTHDLRIGSKAKDVDIKRASLARRSHYDLTSIFEGLFSEKAAQSHTVATSGFKDTTAFLDKYGLLIELHLEVISPNFITPRQTYLLHEIRKLDRFPGLNSSSRDDSLLYLRHLLANSLNSEHTNLHSIWGGRRDDWLDTQPIMPSNMSHIK